MFARVIDEKLALPNARRGEGVGLDDVRARFQVLPMDTRYDLRSGQRQQVVGALQVARPGREASYNFV